MQGNGGVAVLFQDCLPPQRILKKTPLPSGKGVKLEAIVL